MPSISRALRFIIEEERKKSMGDVLGQDWIDEVRRRIDRRHRQEGIMTVDKAINTGHPRQIMVLKEDQIFEEA